jgi:hypothetical protein
MRGYPTLYDGILFLESDIPTMQAVGQIRVDLSFAIGAQLKNLNDVKRKLAIQAHSLSCNSIANFKYGQKSRWLAIDDVAYFGSGVAGVISEDEYRRYIDYIAQRDN